MDEYLSYRINIQNHRDSHTKKKWKTIYKKYTCWKACLYSLIAFFVLNILIEALKFLWSKKFWVFFQSKLFNLDYWFSIFKGEEDNLYLSLWKQNSSPFFRKGPCSDNFCSTWYESPMSFSKFCFQTETRCLANLFLTLVFTISCQHPLFCTSNETSSYSDLSWPKNFPFL